MFEYLQRCKTSHTLEVIAKCCNYDKTTKEITTKSLEELSYNDEIHLLIP